ncbi:hypothetical protein LINGRAHAP2_LOCUS18075, partial [Linum grandiflorum]
MLMEDPSCEEFEKGTLKVNVVKIWTLTNEASLIDDCSASALDTGGGGLLAFA